MNTRGGCMEKRLDKYCDLIVRRGVNIQKGQILFISAPVINAPIIRMIAEKAWAYGAGDVVVHWEDDETEKLRYLNIDIKMLKKYEPWNKLKYDTLSKSGAAFLTVRSSDPEIFKDAPIDKLVGYGKAKSEGWKIFRKLQSGGTLQWCICAVPSAGWANKVFPDEKSSESAVEKLWEAIYSCSRVDKNDVFENWKTHEDDLKKRVSFLNKNDFKSLVYKNSLGTEIEIGLAEGHIWNSAASGKSKTGISYTPNIPTEEAYTAPDRNRTEGVVYGSKPFMFLGTLIEDFAIWFRAGKVIKVKAKKNQEALEKLVSTFKNADRLGEVALVPFNSPVSKSGILFYNTLFDENASCHLALGRASPTWVKGSAGKKESELAKMGINLSTTHNDFMIGTKDLSITGINKSGKSVEVFRNGNFTI